MLKQEPQDISLIHLHKYKKITQNVTSIIQVDFNGRTKQNDKKFEEAEQTTLLKDQEEKNARSGESQAFLGEKESNKVCSLIQAINQRKKTSCKRKG